MLVLRDGEWSWWCSCGFQSPASPSLALLTAGHRCGGPGSPALGEAGTETALQGGGLSAGLCEDSDVGAGFICQVSKLR
jgi:hypothetical protein